jgi:hypothetical protein
VSWSITVVKSLMLNPLFAVIAIAESILTERKVSENNCFLLCAITKVFCKIKNKKNSFFKLIIGYKQQILA